MIRPEDLTQEELAEIIRHIIDALEEENSEIETFSNIGMILLDHTLMDY